MFLDLVFLISCQLKLSFICFLLYNNIFIGNNVLPFYSELTDDEKKSQTPVLPVVKAPIQPRIIANFPIAGVTSTEMFPAVNSKTQNSVLPIQEHFTNLNFNNQAQGHSINQQSAAWTNKNLAILGEIKPQLSQSSERNSVTSPVTSTPPESIAETGSNQGTLQPK